MYGKGSTRGSLVLDDPVPNILECVGTLKKVGERAAYFEARTTNKESNEAGAEASTSM